MNARYFIITINNRLVRYSIGITEEFKNGKWVENSHWFTRIFFNDFTDFREISEEDALKIVHGESVV